MFSFFNKDKKTKAELSRLGTDIHNHVLPGIDDGAKNLKQSVEMLQKLMEMGYHKIIATPHIMSDIYPNDISSIQNALGLLQEELVRQKISLDLSASAEYFTDNYFYELIDQKKLLTFGQKYVLFELSMFQPSAILDNVVFKLQHHNYIPVLAHFERYVFYEDIKPALKLKERGVKIQVNLNSLTGHYGDMQKQKAEKLIDEKIVDLVSTDCHHMHHLELLEAHLKKPYLHKVLDLDLINYKL